MPAKSKVNRTSSNRSPRLGRDISRRKAIESALAIVALGSAGSLWANWQQSMSSAVSGATSACTGPQGAWCACVASQLDSSMDSLLDNNQMPPSQWQSANSEIESDVGVCQSAGETPSTSYWQFH